MVPCGMLLIKILSSIQPSTITHLHEEIFSIVPSQSDWFFVKPGEPANRESDATKSGTRRLRRLRIPDYIRPNRIKQRVLHPEFATSRPLPVETQIIHHKFTWHLHGGVTCIGWALYARRYMHYSCSGDVCRSRGGCSNRPDGFIRVLPPRGRHQSCSGVGW